MANKYPIEVSELIKQLGATISASRRSRQLTQQEIADRSGVSRTTVMAIENGSEDASIGNYLTVLWAMDLHYGVNNLIGHDAGALESLQSNLPKRVRRP